MTMPKIRFLAIKSPNKVDTTIEVDQNTKILAAATRAKVPIRFGCAACRCGTCGVSISGDGELSAMAADEKDLLGRMSLPLDGTARLACRTRIVAGEMTVDLDFQDTYSPDQGEG